MSLADIIIQAMGQSKTDEFDILRKKMRSKKPLNKIDFQGLIQLLEKKAIDILSVEDLAMHEYQMIGKALMASKLRNIDEIIKFAISRDSKRTPIILNCLLNKNCKIDVAPVEEYLSQLICRKMHLCHLKILLVVSKNYPSLITSQVLDFCESNDHPVCKEILSRHRVEIES